MDGLGRSVTLNSPAEKIVSLAPSNTEILYAIGAGGKVVGRDTFSDYPADAGAITDIGGGYGELDMETIVSLAPDLVLAAELTTSEQITSMEDLGLTVYVLKNPVTFEDLYQNLETVGELTGQKAEAESLINSLKDRVSAVQKKVKTATSTPLVFYELDSTDENAPYTSGPGTFVDTLITQAGGVNLGSSLTGTWVQISIEDLLVRQPDVIILGDYTWGGVTPENVVAREAWKSLNAVQNQKIYTFDDNLISRPGPRMVDGLEQMATLIHPELFK